MQRELAGKPMAGIQRNPNSGANGSKIVKFVAEIPNVFKPEAMEGERLGPGTTWDKLDVRGQEAR